MKLAYQIVLCSAIFGLISAGAQAAKRKVPQQYPTIQAAVDASFDGDTIVVSKGTYAPFEVLNKQCLTIQGKKGAVIAMGGGLGIYLSMADSFRLRGLTIVGADDGVRVSNCWGGKIERCVIRDSVNGITISGGSRNITVRKNRLKDISLVAMRIGGAGDNNPSCLVEKNQMTGFVIGVHLEGSEHATIRRNKLRDGNDGGIWLFQTDNALVEENSLVRVTSGISSYGCNGNYILGNKLRDGEIGIYLNAADSYSFVLKNKVRNHSWYGIYADGDFCFVGHNRMRDCVYGIGLHSGAEFNEAFENRMKHCGTGMYVSGLSNQIRDNGSKNSSDTGLFLGPGAAAGNTFVANVWE